MPGSLPLGPAASGAPSLVAEVTAALLNRTDLGSDRVTAALNFAQSEISRLHDFMELKVFTTVSTTFTSDAKADKSITLPALVKHVHTAVLKFGTLSRKLRNKPWRLFDRMFPAPEALARSIPFYYTRWNRTIHLQPVPDMVYPVEMRTTNYPTPFGTDVTQVTDYDSKDDLLIKLAAAYLWRSFGRPDKGLEYEIEVFGPDPGRLGGMFAAAVKQDTDMPDLEVNPSLEDANVLGKYWADPFIKSSP